MFERAYRQRLEAEVARWQAEGVITPATGEAIRNSLPPLGAGINIPVVVGIVGGLLIAAAFLAFVAANWTEITRLLRFAILLAGIAVAYGVGAAFAHAGRPVLADPQPVSAPSSSAPRLRWSGRCTISATTSPPGCCCGPQGRSQRRRSPVLAARSLWRSRPAR